MPTSPPFDNRTDAGTQLAHALKEMNQTLDLVLTIPRGGVPVGYEVAKAFEIPLDVIVTKKIGSPNNPEYALGAVTSSGSVWRNEPAISAMGVDHASFEAKREQAHQAAEKAGEKYQESRPAIDYTNTSVILVDDGVATGSTLRACLHHLSNKHVTRCVLGLPVAPAETVDELNEKVDDLLCLRTPRHFHSVGHYYADFSQVSEQVATELLQEAAWRAP